MGNQDKVVTQEIDDDRSRSEDEVSDDVEWLPPEGGWGCMVVLAFSMVFIVVFGPMSNMGIIFKDFFEIFGDSTSGITMVNGVCSAVTSFSGFFTSMSLKNYSMRQVGILGSLLFVLGSLLTVFTMSIPYMIFTVGVLQGAGFGIMMPIAMSTFNNYFVKKRAAYMGVSSVFVAAGIMAFPIGINFLKENYGFRGTLAVLSGISLHAILAMVIMQPVEWHLVPNRKNYDAESSEMSQIQSNFSSKIGNVICERTVNLASLKMITELDLEPSGNMEPLLGGKDVKRFSISSNMRKDSLAYSEMFDSCKNMVDNFNNNNTNLAKASSVASLGNWATPVLMNEAVSTKNGTWKTFVNSFDLRLLKDIRYSNMCFGMTFAFFSDTTFFILEPTLLYHYGFTQVDVALIVTAGGAADLTFRVIFAIYTFKFSVNSRIVFFIGTCSITVLRIVFMQYQDFYHVLCLTVMLSAFRSWLHIFLPLVFAENCTKEDFPIAYGLFMMVSGILTLILSVIVGVLRDYTNSFTVAFHFLTACCLLLVIPWSIEFYYNYKNKKKSTT